MRSDLTAAADARRRAAAIAQMEQRLLTSRADRKARQEQDRLLAIRRMEQGLWAARRHRDELAWRELMAERVAPVRPTATAGRGWRVLEQPRASHESLDTHARAIWSFVWHGIDWPAGWRVRWGAMNARDLMSFSDLIRDWARQLGRAIALHRCALSSDDLVLGLCIPSQKIILIDEANHRALQRTPRQFDATILHELIHAHVGPDDGDHGPRFTAALAHATDYYFGPADESAPA